jgi:hypothetical protein
MGWLAQRTRGRADGRMVSQVASRELAATASAAGASEPG